MSKKKIFTFGTLTLGLMALASSITTGLLVNNDNSYCQSNTNSLTLENKSLLPATTNIQINNDSSVTLPSSLTTNFQSYNSFCTLPQGVFLVTNPVASLIDPNTNEVIWQLKNADGSNSNIGVNQSYRVFSMQYNPNVSQQGSAGGTLVIAAMCNGGIKITLVNATTGVIYNESSIISFSRENSSDFSTYLYPVQGTVDEYVMISRGWQRLQSDKKRVFSFSLSNLNNITTHTEMNFGEQFNSYRYLTIGSAAAFKSGSDLYLVMLENHEWDNEKNYLKIYRNFEFVDRLLINTGLISYNSCIPNLKVTIDGSNFTVYGVFNPDQENKSTAFCAVWDGSAWSMKYNVTLNSFGYDYDLRTGYYDTNVDRFITYASYANKSSTGGIVVFDLNNPNNSNMTTNGGQVEIFRYRDGDMIGANRINDWFPILTSTSSNISDSNFFITAQGSKYVLYDISAYTSNDDIYHYAYNTNNLGNTLELTGAQNYDLMNKSSSEINEEFSNQFTSLFNQYGSDTKFLIASNYGGNIDSSNYHSDAYYQDVYNGRAHVSLYAIGSIYNQGDYLNITSSTPDFENIYKIDDILLTGFKIYNTTITGPDTFTFDGGENQNNILKLSSKNVKKWIQENFTFTDVTVNFNFDTDVQVSIKKNIYNKIVDVEVKVNNIINNGAVSSTTLYYSFESTDSINYLAIFITIPLLIILMVLILLLVILFIIRKKQRILREISIIDSMLYDK